MKKSVLRKTAAVLTATLVLTLLAGCGKTKAPQSGATATANGAPIKVTALSTWEISDIRPSKDLTLVGKWLEESLSMDLELVTIPGEGITTKINALAAGKQLPTILFTTGDNDAIAEVNMLGEKGVFLNVKDHLDKVPNYAKHLKDDFIRREMSDVNGNIYGFAKIFSDENIMYSTPIIRQDLLKGSPYSAQSIKTIDDLTKVLVYLTEQTKTPAWIQREGYVGFMERVAPMWNLDIKTFYDYEKDAFTHPVLESRLKDFVLWLKDLRAKNVIHPDWAIMTDETWEGMLASNKGSFTLDRMSIIGDNNFSKDFDWQPLNYPQINGKAYLQPNQVSVAPTTSWVINANAPQEQIDKALEFIDFLYDEKNHEVLTLGIEDKTYTKTDPNTMAGIRWLIQIYGENADNKDADFIYEHGIQSFTRLQTPIDMTSFPGTYPEIMYKQIDNIKINLGGFRPASPTVSFSEDVQTMLSTKETSLNTFFDENLIAFIEGKRDMATWDKFIDEMKANGAQEIVSKYNEAYADYKKK